MTRTRRDSLPGPGLGSPACQSRGHWASLSARAKLTESGWQLTLSDCRAHRAPSATPGAPGRRPTRTRSVFIGVGRIAVTKHPSPSPTLLQVRTPSSGDSASAVVGARRASYRHIPASEPAAGGDPRRAAGLVPFKFRAPSRQAASETVTLECGAGWGRGLTPSRFRRFRGLPPYFLAVEAPVTGTRSSGSALGSAGDAPR